MHSCPSVTSTVSLLTLSTTTILTHCVREYPVVGSFLLFYDPRPPSSPEAAETLVVWLLVSLSLSRTSCYYEILWQAALSVIVFVEVDIK